MATQSAGKEEPRRMKKILYILIIGLISGCAKDSVRICIENQLKEFPESRVQDIYKSFCQDNLGPEHLIPNPDAARNYMTSELEEYRQDLEAGLYTIPTLRYYPVGDEGNYVRVDLSVILDGLIGPEEYLDAFVRSANSGIKKSYEQWKKKWAEVERCIRKHYYYIPDAEKNLAAIDSLVKANNLIIHHSDTFVEIYHPHYRIIAKDVFENEILPLLK